MTLDQYLVDYTVRNITTGDEEEVRLLELTDAEVAGLPTEAQAILEPLRHAFQSDNVIPHPDWDAAQDQLLSVLRPLISDPELYEYDYEAWEQNLLDGAYQSTLTDSVPPEEVADVVRSILHVAVEAAIANWAEGFWADYTEATRSRQVLAQFAGFLTAWLETVADEDDPDLAKTVLQYAKEGPQ